MASVVGLTAAPEVSVSTSERGLVNFVSNNELDRLADEEARAKKPKEEEIESNPLVRYVRTMFDGAKVARQETETKMLATLRAIKGEYEPDKLQAIRSFGGSADFIRLTQYKVRDAEAWIMDIINPYGDKTWNIEPTPLADIPPNIAEIMKSKLRARMVQQTISAVTTQGGEFDSATLSQQMEDMEKAVTNKVKKKVQEIANQRANGMRLKILDQFEEGGWNQAFKACVNDLTRMKSCILKGPVFKKVRSLKWEQSNDGKYNPAVSNETIPTFARVSPFDWYPSSNSSHVDDGDAIELEHIKISDLKKVRSAPGYNTKVIDEIIATYPDGFKEDISTDTERRDLEKDNTINYVSTDIIYDMLNFWGEVPGSLLIEYGKKEDNGEDIEADEYYSVNIKVINNQVIKDPVINPDPLGLKPYNITSFVKNNDSQWGESPGDLMDDIQGICNASVRALINNIAISSGPVIEIDVDRLAPGESGDLWPHKKILTTSKKMQEGHAIQFYQAKLLAQELLTVYEKFKRESDDLVVPSYGRTNIGGAGRTSSGLAMLMSAAARNIKLAIYNIDQDLVIPVVNKLFNYNMLFIDDDSIKGDIHVKARGTGGVIAKEQIAVRRNEFRSTLRPTDEQLIGAKGLAYILAKTIESLDMNIDEAMPGYSEIKELEDMAPPPIPPGGATAPGSPPRPATLDVAGGPAGGADEASLFREEPREES